MKIRKFAHSDTPAVAQIYVTAFLAIGENWSMENATKHVEEAVFANDCHYVAVDNSDKIVGFLLAFPSTTVGGTELFIDTIAVLPAYQGAGVGRDLMNTAIDYAQRHRLVAISLSAKPGLASCTWYQKLGFQESGWVEMYKTL
jgi:ribosomal protein S18 acetylase RimI-like enzyme